MKMIQVKSDAQKIAEMLFPEEWKINGDFRIDSNAGRRSVAAEVAQHFIDVLQSEKTANAVMRAFYRREHRKEPNEEESRYLKVHMGTALLAYQMQLAE